MMINDRFRDLHYYVNNVDFNTGEIYSIDVFGVFEEEILMECINKYHSIKNYNDLHKWVKLILSNKYQYKSEYEYNVSPLLKDEIKTKTSVYEQMILNSEIITDMINYKFELGYKK